MMMLSSVLLVPLLLAPARTLDEECAAPTVIQPLGATHGFGWAVDVDGDRALATAWGPPRTAIVLERQRDAWVEVDSMSSPFENDGFGSSVALSRDTVMVGAPNDDQAAGNAGAVHVFRDDGSGTWEPATVLFASDALPQDQFGTAIAIEGARAIVGAPRNDWTLGSAHVLQRDEDGAWQETARLESDPSWTGFGYAVALDGDTAIVGAPGEIGRAVVYELDEGIWHERAVLEAPDADEFGWGALNFGLTVGLGDGTAFVGNLPCYHKSKFGYICVSESTLSCFTHEAGQWTIAETWRFPFPPVSLAVEPGRVGLALGAGDTERAVVLHERDDRGTWKRRAVHAMADHVSSVALLADGVLAGVPAHDADAGALLELTDACRHADIDADGVVGISDLLAVMAAWGPCGAKCAPDVDGNGVVDGDDLATILAWWWP